MKISIEFQINLFSRKPAHNSLQIKLAFPDPFKQINPKKRDNISSFREKEVQRTIPALGEVS
jgi:hypothetical protein